MTNKEYIIACLNDEIDDGGASFESMVHYNINCPYHIFDKKAHCMNKSCNYPSRKHCVPCKIEWLESEVEQ